MLVSLYMPMCTFFVVQTHTNTHTCLSLFAVCFTIIANTPLPSVHFTHDVAHLFTHLSELLCVIVCVCVHCELSCEAGAVLINGPSRWHMAMSSGAVACRIANWTDKSLCTWLCAYWCANIAYATHQVEFWAPISLSLSASSLPTNYCHRCQHHSHISVQSVGGVVCRVCKLGLLKSSWSAHIMSCQCQLLPTVRLHSDA